MLVAWIGAVSPRSLFHAGTEGELLVALAAQADTLHGCAIDQAVSAQDIVTASKGLGQLEKLLARIARRESEISELLRSGGEPCRRRLHGVLCRALDVVHAIAVQAIASRTQRQRFALQIESVLGALDGRKGIATALTTLDAERLLLLAKLISEVEHFSVAEAVTTAELAWISELLGGLLAAHDAHLSAAMPPSRVAGWILALPAHCVRTWRQDVSWVVEEESPRGHDDDAAAAAATETGGDGYRRWLWLARWQVVGAAGLLLAAAGSATHHAWSAHRQFGDTGPSKSVVVRLLATLFSRNPHTTGLE